MYCEMPFEDLGTKGRKGGGRGRVIGRTVCVCGGRGSKQRRGVLEPLPSHHPLLLLLLLTPPRPQINQTHPHPTPLNISHQHQKPSPSTQENKETRKKHTPPATTTTHNACTHCEHNSNNSPRVLCEGFCSYRLHTIAR
jgi:hypothetical protein